MATLNVKKLRMNVGSFAPIKSAALELAESKLQSDRNFLLGEFNNHPVTKEIEAGPNSQNSSMTLGGYGNLFSFIGFESGQNPTFVIKQMINKIRLIKKSYSKPSRSGSEISFNVVTPQLQDFEKNTPMPWSPGRSWLSGIEKGISGFGYYISRKLSGRSEGGLQANNKLRGGSFRNVSYFSKMYSNFLQRLTGGRAR